MFLWSPSKHSNTSVPKSTSMADFFTRLKDNYDIQNELNSSDWQHAFVSRNQRAPLVCASTLSVHYTEEQTLLTRKEAKKANSTLTLNLWHKGAALCAYRGGSNALYDSIMCVVTHHLSTLLWTLGAPFRRRQTRHHSFTRLLGAFVRWLLGKKGKQINTSPMGLTGNLYLEWNMSTSLLDSLTVAGQLTSAKEAIFLCY